MPYLTATFSDGCTLRRNSINNYSHAWRVCWLRPLNDNGQPVDSRGNVYERRDGSESGFASSATLAERAANTVARRIASLGKYEITKNEIVEVADRPAKPDGG